MANITMVPVESSNVQAHGYDPETQTLRIEYKGGRQYDYAGVPPEKHAEGEAIAADPSRSFGSHVSQNIKPHHACTRVGG